jgi:hypothetical protein
VMSQHVLTKETDTGKGWERRKNRSQWNVCFANYN